MSEFLGVLSFSFSVTGPIFIILLLGVWFMRIGILNEAFIETGSRLVFTVALPALLFVSISKTHFSAAANFDLIIFAAIATVLSVVLLEAATHYLIMPAEDRGVVVQGAFRSNMGIIGLAYCVNAYGDNGLVAASLYLGLITILFNVLAVITLSRSLHKSQGVGKVVRGIATNPLIIGILLALPVSYAGIKLPTVLLESGEYFSKMTLPLALLCTGASLDFHSLRQEMGKTLFASVSKLVLTPLLFVLGGLWMGFRGVDMGILLLMSSAPTAAASYIMVRAMGGNAPLAANIIALTTLGSVVTTSIGITVLRGLGLM
ncbi:AEC family transporter [Candidatus Thiothrix sp. Deng01]|uniref:AEC family transporter n=1 Tax=Candidatus Thiothrix phosphatis TaxID=3112415 RepID=A0ABU6D2K1_9GAMM|nr:AEC family transporter [Candidatus Thiothrix sp. Deng01]MEB4593016.1 AEC family transporter [Candidatus Thiothrix sp. Deng01]